MLIYKLHCVEVGNEISSRYYASLIYERYSVLKIGYNNGFLLPDPYNINRLFVSLSMVTRIITRIKYIQHCERRSTYVQINQRTIVNQYQAHYASLISGYNIMRHNGKSRHKKRTVSFVIFCHYQPYFKVNVMIKLLLRLSNGTRCIFFRFDITCSLAFYRT